MAASDGLPVTFERVLLATPGGPRVALVASPTDHVVIGQERLVDLRRPVQRPSATDEAIVQTARATGQLALFIWRARTDAGSWTFDPELSDEDCLELGYHIGRSLLPVFRRLVAAGCLLCVHAELGFREAEALSKQGAARLRDETDAGGGVSGSTSRMQAVPVRALDQWILRHVPLYLASSYSTVIGGTLPSMWSMVDRRSQVARALIDALPPGVV